MKTLAVLLLGSTLLSAADPTPWKYMSSATGDVTVTLKSGKKVKRTDTVAFHPTELQFASDGRSVARAEIKEVVIRAHRELCCGPLWNGLGFFLFDLAAITESHDADGIIEGVLLLPVCTALAAVMTPPALAVEGIRRLKPAKILYRVAP